MKLRFLVLSALLALSTCEIGHSNMEDAANPEDISAFRAMHDNDDHVLFFHNSGDKNDEGFFQSIFGIFGQNSELDEEYQKILSDKYPTLEVDTSKQPLKNVKDDFKIKELPYVIAYHKGKEIWREQPSKDTTGIIENKIKEQDNAKVETYKKTDTTAENQKRVPPPTTTTQVQNQQKLNEEQRKQQLANQKRQQEEYERKQREEYERRQRENQNRKKTSNNGVIDNSYVDPFDQNKHYKLDDSIQDNDSSYSNGYSNGYGYQNGYNSYGSNDATSVNRGYYQNGEYVSQPYSYSSQPVNTYATQPSTTYVSQPTTTYVSQPATTYVAQPDTSFVVQQDVNYVPQPANTYVVQSTDYPPQQTTYVVQSNDNTAQPINYSTQPAPNYVAQPSTTYVTQPTNYVVQQDTYNPQPQTVYVPQQPTPNAQQTTYASQGQQYNPPQQQANYASNNNIYASSAPVQNKNNEASWRNDASWKSDASYYAIGGSVGIAEVADFEQGVELN
ncbi:unnamed protein product [Moneuplotes crassus]|uniref:Uncharacterized protein n=1 Tax=Euplotes crassus TaxID=5936 RepID=A0AAD1X5H2_EUPCR|nr:unnamed protein product [Moneuplotes crassus]